MFHFKLFGKSFVASAWVIAIQGMMGAAYAANVAVVCVESPSPAGVAHAVSGRLRQVMVGRQLEGHYDHLEFVSCQTSSDERVLLEKISSFARTHRTDFLDLRIQSADSSSLDFDRALRLDLATRASNRFAKLRWVHMASNEGSLGEMASAWILAGAQAVSVRGPAPSEVQDRSFVAELLSQWTQGAWLSDAAAKASVTAGRFSIALSRWLSRSRGASSIGVRLYGKDVRQLDSSTRELRWDGRTWVRTSEQGGESLSLSSSPTDSEVSGVQLFGALTLPGAPLQPTVGGVSELIERASGPAWELLKNGFPDPVPALPGRIGEDGQDGELSWIDGDGLRYFLKPLQSWLGDGTNRFLQEILGLRLQRKEIGLRTAFHLKQAITLSLAQAGFKIPDGEVESVHFPRTLRLSIRIVQGVADIQFLPVVDEPLSIEIAWNGLPLSVVPTLARADLSTGDGQIEATVLGGFVSLVAKVNLYEKRFGGIDLWESIDRSLSRFELPKLHFTKK